MATHDYFAHESPVTGKGATQLGRDAGYPLPQHGHVGESLFAGNGQAASALKALIRDGGHDDGGHRVHLLGIGGWRNDREIGIGYSHNSAARWKHYWAAHTSRQGPDQKFLTGVIFHDANGNSRYEAGEGLGGVTVGAGGSTTVTNEQGGWALRVEDGEYRVTASGGAFQGAASVPVTVAGQSVEVDFLSGQPGAQIDFRPWSDEEPDGDTRTLTLALSEPEVYEGTWIEGPTATVTRVGGDLSAPLTVTLTSSDPSQASIPQTVTIDAGETAATFLVQPVNDALLEGTHAITLTVAAEGYRGEPSGNHHRRRKGHRKIVAELGGTVRCGRQRPGGPARLADGRAAVAKLTALAAWATCRT